MNSKWDFHFEKAEKLEPSTETAKEEEPAKSSPQKAAKSPKKKSKKKSPTKTTKQSPKNKEKSKAKQPLSPYEQIRSPSSTGKKRKSPKSSDSGEKKRKSPRTLENEKKQKKKLSESEQKVHQARKSAEKVKRELEASAAKPEEEKKDDDAVVDLTFDDSDSEWANVEVSCLPRKEMRSNSIVVIHCIDIWKSNAIKKEKTKRLGVLTRVYYCSPSYFLNCLATVDIQHFTQLHTKSSLHDECQANQSTASS